MRFLVNLSTDASRTKNLRIACVDDFHVFYLDGTKTDDPWSTRRVPVWKQGMPPSGKVTKVSIDVKDGRSRAMSITSRAVDAVLRVIGSDARARLEALDAEIATINQRSRDIRHQLDEERQRLLKERATLLEQAFQTAAAAPLEEVRKRIGK